jgi:hypothetical protein
VAQHARSLERSQPEAINPSTITFSATMTECFTIRIPYGDVKMALNLIFLVNSSCGRHFIFVPQEISEIEPKFIRSSHGFKAELID